LPAKFGVSTPGPFREGRTDIARLLKKEQVLWTKGGHQKADPDAMETLFAVNGLRLYR